ncbi:MAG: phosphoenolpyruvate-utilizing N-terminal domain-containing protein, partial [Chromatiales bacterium]|nr:phosphoenolpyruvate-utilizing N-terminal domain-containing protein [Chromatiales bacterium]
MLDILRRIVQEVNAAENLGQALHIIVNRVRQALVLDVCSVYLSLPDRQQLVLMATEGLNPDSVGRVRLDYSEGLTGLVAQRAEPVNLDNAPDHPRYKYFPETGEERYHAFLGVPIIHQRKLLGVLVVQQREQRRYDDEHVAFLVTLAAQLAGAISHAEITGEVGTLRNVEPQGNLRLVGIAGSAGIAVGVGVAAYAQADLDVVPDRTPLSVDEEIARFQAALDGVREEVSSLKQRLSQVLPAEESLVFDAFLMMLGGDSLVSRTIQRIRDGNWAPGALRDTIRESTRVFEEMEDPYLRERAADLRDIGRRVLTRLLPVQRGAEDFPPNTILIGDDLTAAQMAEVPADRLVGLVSARGTGSSHVAILARAMGLPAVMGVSDLPVGRLEGREIVVDGYRGQLVIEPGAELKQE